MTGEILNFMFLHLETWMTGNHWKQGKFLEMNIKGKLCADTEDTYKLGLCLKTTFLNSIQLVAKVKNNMRTH